MKNKAIEKLVIVLVMILSVFIGSGNCAYAADKRAEFTVESSNDSLAGTDIDQYLETEQTTTEQETTETVNSRSVTTQSDKEGWVKESGKTYYYKNGIMVTGWEHIDEYTYYFDETTGVMQISKMIAKNKYVDKKGRLVDKSQIYDNGKKGLKDLDKKLRKQIKKYKGTHCIYVKNLDTNEWMVINNKKMTPASLIKLYNMATVYDQIEKGKIKETSSVKSKLKSMITVSSNDSYNELLSKIGKGTTKKGVKTVNKFCKENGYKNTQAGGTLSPTYVKRVSVGKSYSSVRDCGHILEDIYRGNMVSENASKKMLKYLKAQQRKSKIPAGLPKGVKTANKTGETSRLQHDAAIVFSNNADYVIVVMTENDGASISHIRTLSRIVYDYFNK